MIKLAIVGTGGMANIHARMFKTIPGVQLVAACDVDPQRVAAFAEAHGIPWTYTDVKDLIRAGGFDAASNVTPDRFHAPVSIALLRAGKHVLCEKPLAVNYTEAKKMADEAKKAGVINMVNFSYRNSSVIHKAHDMVSKGKLGRILHVEASYLQGWLAQNTWGDWRKTPAWLWRLSTAHGSMGVLGDIGVHLIDFATYPVDDITSVQCRLKTFDKAPGNKVGEYVLDANDSAIITLEFANGALGTLHTTRWASGHANTVSLAIYGEKAALKINLDTSYRELQFCQIKNRKPGEWKTIDCGDTPSMYHRFIKSIKTGKNDQPDFARGAAIQKALDACMKSAKTDKTILL